VNLTVKEIAEIVGGRVVGNDSLRITGAAGLGEAGPSDISFVKSAEVKKEKIETKAGAVLVNSTVVVEGSVNIHVENPLSAFSTLLSLIAKEKRPIKPGVHPSAIVSPSAVLGKSVSVGPLAIIEDGAILEDDVVVMGHAYVGQRSRIGKGTLLYPHVVVREEITIGARCILQVGCVIGSDGYGFYYANGKHNKIEQVGTVVLEDDVEIGAGAAIDRATTGKTVIGKGTKLDNLVHVAHNVTIGDHSLLAAQSGIAGSTKLGKLVVLGGQVGVGDHIVVGDGVQVGAQSGIKSNVESGEVLFGTPAQPLQETLKQILLVRKLPELFKDVKKIKQESGLIEK
jgi:UDP-3-O-[3-hydroxymyristoyl] glucosamine N-acyltransferase